MVLPTVANESVVRYDHAYMTLRECLAPTRSAIEDLHHAVRTYTCTILPHRLLSFLYGAV